MNKPLRLDLREPARTHVENLKSRLRLEAISEVIRRALAILDYITTKRSEGFTIILRDKDGNESNFPDFDNKE